MEPPARLGILDYVVIGASLLIATAIGIQFRIKNEKKRNTKEYLLAGKDMSMLPVIMSITVTMLSGVTMLGHPGEMYRYGIQYMVICLGLPFGVYLATVVFLPVYFNCEVSTSYEFLELRYGKILRYTISGVFMIQMILFMSVVLYAPALALSAVTDLSMEVSIIVFGLVCTTYSAIGGLRAVMWTDVFQAGLMFFCMLAMYIKGIGESGGIVEIFKTSYEGQRLNIFDFNEDFSKRYTFLNSFCRGLAGLALYGTSQIEVQRTLSMRSLKRAKSVLIYSILPVAILLLMCGLLGLVLYTIFRTCDPVADKAHTGVKKYDQIIPYYMVTRFNFIPGLTGMCIAGIFSGSLSTVSSALSSLASVSIVDFIKPICKSPKLTETRVVFIAKVLSFANGIICISLTFLTSKVDSLVAVNSTVLSLMEGPMLAVFLVAVLTRKGSEKCVLFGLLLGVAFTTWIGSGIVLSGYHTPHLPLGSDCPSLHNSSDAFNNSMNLCADNQLCTTAVPPPTKSSSEIFFLYKVSFIWLPVIGCSATLCFIFAAIFATGWSHNAIPADSKCLSPVSRFWIKSENLESQLRELSEEKTALNTSNG
ncbi:putative sodium-dependent multivitamin transporter [Caerostris darwini]|uniref:Sodium-dependent multivitamin transporter n=1 Tax=Caerostris darwini TaxID=1538125 RepID=A0AAV4PDJ5_9ARAC|nr:putative sodium-dependent multivitamin transporter [Caerostris darwini]